MPGSVVVHFMADSAQTLVFKAADSAGLPILKLSDQAAADILSLMISIVVFYRKKLVVIRN